MFSLLGWTGDIQSNIWRIMFKVRWVQTQTNKNTNNNQHNLCRQDLFVTSKLWNTFHHPQHVETACRHENYHQSWDLKYSSGRHCLIWSLNILIFTSFIFQSGKVSNLPTFWWDLFDSLKFVPIEERYPPGWSADPCVSKEMKFENISVQDTWRAMEMLVEKGLVRCKNKIVFYLTISFSQWIFSEILESVTGTVKDWEIWYLFLKSNLLYYRYQKCFLFKSFVFFR